MSAANPAILKAAHAHIRGDLAGPKESGMCLSLVRQIVERACYQGRYEWYSRYLTRPIERVDGAPSAVAEPWARDMERSLRAAGMALELLTNGRYVTTDSRHLLPGDLLFRWDAAPTTKALLEPRYIGHVGVLLEGQLVLENIAPANRKNSFQRRVSALTALKDFPVTTVIRFDPSRPAAPAL